MRIDLTRASESLAKHDRSDELVDGDESHQQQLDLRPPSRKLGGDDRGEPEGDP